MELLCLPGSQMSATTNNKVGDKVQFWQPNYKISLINSTSVAKRSAVEIAFESVSSDERILKEATLL